MAVLETNDIVCLAGNDNEFPNASRSDVEAGLAVLRQAGAPLLAHAELVSHVDVQARGTETEAIPMAPAVEGLPSPA